MDTQVIRHYLALPRAAQVHRWPLLGLVMPTVLLALALAIGFRWPFMRQFAVVGSLRLLCYALVLFWAFRMAGAALLLRDARALKVPAPSMRIGNSLLFWLVCTTLPSIGLCLAWGLPLASSLFVLLSAVLAGTAICLMPKWPANLLSGVVAVAVNLLPFDSLSMREVLVCALGDALLLLWGLQGARAIVAGRAAHRFLGPPMILELEHKAGKRFGHRRWRGVGAGFYRARHHPSPEMRDSSWRMIGAALGPEFLYRGHVAKVIFLGLATFGLIVSGGAIRLTGLISLFIGQSEGARLHAFVGDYIGVATAMAVLALLAIPMISLRRLSAIWAAPSADLAFLAHLPALGTPSAIKLRTLVAASMNALFLLYLWTVVFAITAEVFGGHAGAVRAIGAVAIGSTVIRLSLTVAIISEGLSRTTYVVGSVLGWFLVGLTTGAVSSHLWAGPGDAMSHNLMFATEIVWTIVIAGALYLGARGAVALWRQPHPFLARPC